VLLAVVSVSLHALLVSGPLFCPPFESKVTAPPLPCVCGVLVVGWGFGKDASLAVGPRDRSKGVKALARLVAGDPGLLGIVLHHIREGLTATAISVRAQGSRPSAGDSRSVHPHAVSSPKLIRPLSSA